MVKKICTIVLVVLIFAFIQSTQADDAKTTQVDIAKVEVLLKATWDEMTASLLAGDIEKALSYFVAASRERYRREFTKMGREGIRKRFAGINELKVNSVDERVADCGAIRIESRGTYSYPVTFVKDENGIWKIMGF